MIIIACLNVRFMKRLINGLEVSFSVSETWMRFTIADIITIMDKEKSKSSALKHQIFGVWLLGIISTVFFSFSIY